MASIAARSFFRSVSRIRPQTSYKSFNGWGWGWGGSKVPKELPFEHRPTWRSMDTDRAGAIRESGDAFGKREKAEEERFFKKLQKEQLSKLKSDVHNEIKHHEQQIKHHEEALKRHKQRLAEMPKE